MFEFVLESDNIFTDKLCRVNIPDAYNINYFGQSLPSPSVAFTEQTNSLQDSSEREP